jgi:translation initiation factor IF-3
MIDEDGAQLGIMTIQEAMRIAIDKDLDLVKIAPTSKPPVCKIMDYGKYRYEQAKRVKDVRRHQHVVEVKEIRMSPSIGINDFNTKLRNGLKFLREGDRLKVTIRFRGREMAHTDIGEKLLKKFADECAEFGNVDKNPKLDGRFMSMFLTPKQIKGEGSKEPKAPKSEPGQIKAEAKKVTKKETINDAED